MRDVPAVVLHNGQVVDQCGHEELLAQEDALCRHYYALQFQWGVEGLPHDLAAPLDR